jgi:hypothetical protein
MAPDPSGAISYLGEGYAAISCADREFAFRNYSLDDPVRLIASLAALITSGGME